MKNRNSKKLRLFVRAAVLMCALFVVFTGCPQQLDPPAPRETVYTVEHRQQNADNDEYTLAERETVHAKEGETTRAQSKNYPGFTAQSPQNNRGR
ncbi:hypothetical protein V1L52_03040 [Treponema sp. HNW]|uniref:hypothetical protein n=1 Tax=Treponema sp. HNW TaxID=3116654 RepID=UPI003D1347CC